MIDNFPEPSIGRSGEIVKETQEAKTEVLTGFEVAEKAKEIYEILGPEIGCRIVQPNVVMALAGLKCLADIPWVKLDQTRLDKLKIVNQQIEDLGIRFNFSEKIDNQSEVTNISITNIKGLERKTQQTKIPGIVKLKTKSSWEYYEKWRSNFRQSLQAVQKRGEISSKVDLEILEEGVLLGYPDQAIWDFEDHLRKRNTRLIESDIVSSNKQAQKYAGAVPDFDYYPEHQNNPEIVKYIADAKKILNEFYTSEWYKLVINDADFLAGRKKIDSKIENILRIY